MVKEETNLVAGVTPGKGGQEVHGIPVFDSVFEAVTSSGCDISLIVVPAVYAKQAVFEAIDAGIKKVVVYSESVPVHDSILISLYARLNGAIVLGPNSAGTISPGKCNVSDINPRFIKQGSLGIVSKSGTLTYEVFDGVGKYGVGVSTLVCLGGDPVLATGYSEILRLFETDDDTKVVVLLGEIGGGQELSSVATIRSMTKPVFAYIAGASAPPNKRLGHAGAVIGSDMETAAYKAEQLARSGAQTAKTVQELIELVGDWFRKNSG